MRLAVIPGDGIGPEVVDEALKVLHARSSRTSRPRTYDLGAARWHSDRRAAAGRRCSPSCSEHDAILLGAVGDPPSRRASSSAACCCGCASSSTTTSTCARRGCTPACAARSPGKPAIDMLVVREGTEGPYAGRRACCARTPRTRSPPRSASTPRSAWSGWCATRSTRAERRAAQAPHAGAQDQRAHLRRRAVVAAGGGGVAGVPGRHRAYQHVDAAMIYWSPTRAGST